MKTREIQCKHYICKHQCDLGKDAEFYGVCQKCQKYEKKTGALPKRVNNKKKILEKEKLDSF